MKLPPSPWKVLATPSPFLLGVNVIEHVAFVAIVHIFETRLKELNPHVPSVTYDISHLHQYIDSLTDVCALVYALTFKYDCSNLLTRDWGRFDKQTRQYAPRDRQWIKDKLLNHLRRVAKRH